MFGWKRKQLSPREELTLSYFLSLDILIAPDSISYATYRGYNGSAAGACLAVGFGKDRLDQGYRGFLMEMCDATFVRGREIDSAVSSFHKKAHLMSKISNQPLFDQIEKLQDRRDKLDDDLAEH